MFPVKPVYSFVYTGPKMGKEKGTRDVASPLSIGSSGGRIRTSDLRVMSPTSYQAALPRDRCLTLGHRRGLSSEPGERCTTFVQCRYRYEPLFAKLSAGGLIEH